MEDKKPYDKNKIRLIIMSVLIGLVFCAYLLYNKYGKLGQLEFISLGITAVIAFGVSFIMIKKGNKK